MSLFKNRLFVGIMCLGLALIIGFIAVPVINNLTSQTIEVVRVKADVTMGTQLKEDMLEKVEVGKLNLPQATATDINTVVNLYATVDFRAGDIITGAKVTDKLVLPENKIRQMKSGETTISIPLGNSAYTKLLPNDIVSIYTSNETGNVQVIPELRYVSVVTTATSEGVDILTSNQVGANGGQLIASKITFILTETQVRKLLSVSRSGNFYILLKYRGDNEATINNYLAQQTSYLQGAASAVNNEAATNSQPEQQ